MSLGACEPVLINCSPNYGCSWPFLLPLVSDTMSHPGSCCLNTSSDPIWETAVPDDFKPQCGQEPTGLRSPCLASMTDFSSLPLTTLSPNHTSCPGDRPTPTHHLLQSYFSIDLGTTTPICPPGLSPALLKIQQKLLKRLEQSPAPDGYLNCSCQQPLSWHYHGQGLQSQPSMAFPIIEHSLRS